MTDDTTKVDAQIATSAERITYIQNLFVSIKEMLDIQVTEVGPAKSGAPKAILAKLSELQTAQVALIKAEEAYNAKYGRSDDDDAVDYDAIRLALGSRLDRIREQASAGSIFKRAEPA